MSEPLVVAVNSNVHAVMTERQWLYLHEPDIGLYEHNRRLREDVTILAFARQMTLRRWGIDDPRFKGVAGSMEDLSPIIRRHCIVIQPFFVPFSNGRAMAESELQFYRATWEGFRMVFGPDDWTFKFGRHPDWMTVRITDTDYTGADRHNEIW